MTPTPDATSSDAAFVITRRFDAPRDLVWRAWTELDRLQRWFGPKGVTLRDCTLDLRPGGVFHYGMAMPDGSSIWGRWVLREIVPPEPLVFVSSFSDAAGGLTRNPWTAAWPMETLSAVTLAEQDGRTTVTVTWTPLDATPAERAGFTAGHSSMQQGWTGTLDKLSEHLVAGCRSPPPGVG